MARRFNRLVHGISGQQMHLSLDSAPVSAYPLTMACWFRPKNLSGTNPDLLMSLSSSTGQNWFGLWINNLGATVRAYAYDGTVGDANAAAVSNGAWAHCAAVFTSAANRTAYKDGVGVNSTSGSPSPSGVNRFDIGTVWSSGARITPYTEGDIAEAAIWNVALTADEVSGLAAGVSPLLVRRHSLVRYWPLLGQNPSSPFDLPIIGEELISDIRPDATSSLDYGATKSWSHTVGHAATVALVYVRSDSDGITGVTLGGQAMTLIQSHLLSGLYRYAVYGLVNPPTGSQTVTLTGTGDAAAAALTYANASVVGFPNNSSQQTFGSSPVSMSLTPTVDRCWGVLFAADRSGTPPAASTNATARVAPGAGASMQAFDSNGPITPAASFTMAATGSGAMSGLYVILAPGPSKADHPRIIYPY